MTAREPRRRPTPSGVAGIRRNQWLASVGIIGWKGLESPAGLRRNTHVGGVAGKKGSVAAYPARLPVSPAARVSEDRQARPGHDGRDVENQGVEPWPRRFPSIGPWSVRCRLPASSEATRLPGRRSRPGATHGSRSRPASGGRKASAIHDPQRDRAAPRGPTSGRSRWLRSPALGRSFQQLAGHIREPARQRGPRLAGCSLPQKRPETCVGSRGQQRLRGRRKARSTLLRYTPK